MAADPHALSTVQPEPPADTDYDAICAAVTATARGRWFLDEYAKRNRNSDTTQVLAAIARMEANVVGERTQQASREAHQEVRIELLEMARTIAQARAEVVESRPDPARPGAPESANTLSPDVAAAAERLRQIAWTMRACGIELPASDQIAQIAETILSADALRGLGDQRAHKLTEALTYLEHRIDRMLDSQRAAVSGAETDPASEAAAAAANRHDRDPPLATTAVAMIAAAMRANEAAAAKAAPATTVAEQTAPAQSDVAEYPMDDDVVLTVADSTVAPVAASLAAEAETTVAVIEPASPADSQPAAQATLDAQTPRDERIEIEIEPLMPATPQAAANEAAPGFAALELAPLAVAPAEETRAPDEAEPPGEPQAAAAQAIPKKTAPTVEERAAEPLAEAPPTTTAAIEATPKPDAIAAQVDQDLDGLTAVPPDQRPADEAASATPVAAAPAKEQAPYPQLVHTTLRDDEPAEFLLEESPRKVPVSALVASAQASRAQLSDTLAAIESELFGSTRPPGDAASGPAEGAILAKPARAPAAEGPLAALAAMSEEERIALFS